jgi:hypothetical protein
MRLIPHPCGGFFVDPGYIADLDWAEGHLLTYPFLGERCPLPVNATATLYADNRLLDWQHIVWLLGFLKEVIDMEFSLYSQAGCPLTVELVHLYRKEYVKISPLLLKKGIIETPADRLVYTREQALGVWSFLSSTAPALGTAATANANILLPHIRDSLGGETDEIMNMQASVDYDLLWRAMLVQIASEVNMYLTFWMNGGRLMESQRSVDEQRARARQEHALASAAMEAWIQGEMERTGESREMVLHRDRGGGSDLPPTGYPSQEVLAGLT